MYSRADNRKTQTKNRININVGLHTELSAIRDSVEPPLKGARQNPFFCRFAGILVLCTCAITIWH